MTDRLPTSSFFLILVVALCLSSCNHNVKYNEFRVIPTSGWTMNTQCEFEVEMTDTIQMHDVYLNIRHSGNYPYQNLSLLVERHSPDNALYNDTINLRMIDKTGKWLGKGTGSVFLLSIPFQTWRVEKPGKYTFKIKHWMSDSNLQGVYAIGLSIGLVDGKE